MYWNQLTPSSPFYSSGTPSDRLYSLRCAAPVAHYSSTIVRKALHFTDDILARFDCISELGGEDVCGEEIGHAGCVNALAWSQSGHCLATGSDDRRVILWRLGGSDDHPSGVSPSRYQNATDGRSFPRLDLAQSDVVETGHRANIFNVKWAPNCSDRRLFTCAGDNQVRVFDLSRATSAAAINRPMTSGREYKLWQEGQGACTRVLRCHSSRAKKISTENSPDIFLTAAEDGEVRQTDLRVSHTCSRSHNNYGQGCPRPLVQFQMELYSLSVSKLEPWLFAVSGSSDKVFLQDRRMIPRLLKKEWGSYIDEETAALTHCVRRFTREPPSDPNSPSARRGRRAHITAVKISEANGRDLLASFSGDGVYRFDIKSEVGLPKTQGEEERTHLHSSKRQKTAASGGLDAAVEEAASAIQNPLEGRDDCASIRRAVVSLLFLQGADNRVTRRYSKMLAELDQMNESIHSMLRPAKWLARERCTIAICRVLIQIRRATAGLVETVDIDFTSLKEGLDADLTEEAREIVVPLLEEMEEANNWRAYSEEVKIRVLLWARTEEYIRAWWKDAWPEEEMREDEAIDSQLQRTAETRVGDVLEEEADRPEPGTSTPPRHSEVESGADRDWEDQSNTGDESEDEDEDIDVDEDDLSDEESSEDEEDRNKHGISGGDAAIAYPRSCYTGHANLETVKDCGFLGSNDEYIWSGSDCGHFFVWSNDNVGKLLGVWKGDGSVVNVLAQHPSLPICAVSGIDETIKIFGPVSRGSPRHTDAFARRDEIMQRNNEQEGSVGFSSQSLMRLFARHMAAAQDIPLPLARQRAGEGQDDDCLIA